MRPFDRTWIRRLGNLLENGREVSPRGKRTKELPSATLVVDMRRPVLTVAERKLNYKFMAAEARWILTGDDTVAGIAPWNPRICDFSDDGVRFFGAYGPKVHSQIDYVVAKLLEDRDSRQAGLTLWRENPPKTKDVPCTVAMFFGVRRDSAHEPRLNSHVFMRSNDVWLGTPYDVFNFSMVNHLVCCRLNRHIGAIESTPIEPGVLHLTAASSHLYEEQWEVARALVDAGPDVDMVDQPETPRNLHLDEDALVERLTALRDARPGDPLRWWEMVLR